MLKLANVPVTCNYKSQPDTMNIQRLQLGINKHLISTRRSMHLLSRNTMAKSGGEYISLTLKKSRGRSSRAGMVATWCPQWTGFLLCSCFTIFNSYFHLWRLLVITDCHCGSSHPSHILGRKEGLGKSKGFLTASESP